MGQVLPKRTEPQAPQEERLLLHEQDPRPQRKRKDAQDLSYLRGLSCFNGGISSRCGQKDLFPPKQQTRRWCSGVRRAATTPHPTMLFHENSALQSLAHPIASPLPEPEQVNRLHGRTRHRSYRRPRCPRDEQQATQHRSSPSGHRSQRRCGARTSFAVMGSPASSLAETSSGDKAASFLFFAVCRRIDSRISRAPKAFDLFFVQLLRGLAGDSQVSRGEQRQDDSILIGGPQCVLAQENLRFPLPKPSSALTKPGTKYLKPTGTSTVAANRISNAIDECRTG